MTNPFSTRFIRPGAIPYVFPTGESAAALVEQLQSQQWWGQIIGPHGSGKSTLLATLVLALEAAGRTVITFSLHQGQHRLPPLDHASLTAHTQLVIDGYEQLSWWNKGRLKSLCRRLGCGLLVTAHADMGLPTLYHISPTVETTAAVVANLLPQGDVRITPEVIAAAFIATGGNPRETLFRLYDVYRQGQADPKS